jgi:hypothetical protein
MSVNTTSLGALLHVRCTASSYKRWCSTSYMQQCSQWSCVDWHTIQAMMQYILHAAMLPVHHRLYCMSVNTTSLGALLHVRCTASSLVLYVSQHNFTGSIDTIQAMMQYILHAAMLPVKLCWLTYNTSDDDCMSVNTTSLGALLHIRCTASLLVLYVSQHNFTGSIAAYKMYCIIACIVCQSTQLHREHCYAAMLPVKLCWLTYNTTMMQYILYAAMLPVKLCWLTYNTSDDAVHLTCSNAPSEVVLTDIQYKQCIACIVCQSTQLHREHCCI